MHETDVNTGRDYVMSASGVDFMFFLPRPEFADFIMPARQALEQQGFVCRSCGVDDVDIAAEMRPRVLVTTNETPHIALFKQSRCVLVGHSIYIRDTLSTPPEQGVAHYLDFDYYFVPSVFYMSWALRALFDVHYFCPDKADELRTQGRLLKHVIPGGYAKNLKVPAQTRAADARPLILYAPSVFFDTHDNQGHRFHLDGVDLLKALAKRYPQADIVCRPHPTDRFRQYVLDAIATLSVYPNVRFDLDAVPDPALYSKPDVLITDMSGFAFTYELQTQRRPIFVLNREEIAVNPRFHSLAKQYGRIVGSADHLVAMVGHQLREPDLLNTEQTARFRSLFGFPFNSALALTQDLVHIHAGTSAEHWVSVPLGY